MTASQGISEHSDNMTKSSGPDPKKKGGRHQAHALSPLHPRELVGRAVHGALPPEAIAGPRAGSRVDRSCVLVIPAQAGATLKQVQDQTAQGHYLVKGWGGAERNPGRSGGP